MTRLSPQLAWPCSRRTRRRTRPVSAPPEPFLDPATRVPDDYLYVANLAMIDWLKGQRLPHFALACYCQAARFTPAEYLLAFDQLVKLLEEAQDVVEECGPYLERCILQRRRLRWRGRFHRVR
jgi:hypothetical protein